MWEVRLNTVISGGLSLQDRDVGATLLCFSAVNWNGPNFLSKEEQSPRCRPRAASYLVRWGSDCPHRVAVGLGPLCSESVC